MDKMKRRALILEAGGVFQEVEQYLKFAIEMNECDAVFHQSSDCFWTQMKEGVEDYDFLAINPTAEGFNLEKTMGILSKLELHGLPPILYVGHDSKKEVTSSRALNAAARITESFTSYQVGFIVNHILYPVLMDKREYPRVPVSLDVEYQTAVGDYKEKCQALNVSAGGVFLETQRKFEERSLLELTVHLPREMDPVECTGRVVFQQPEYEAFREIHPAGLGVHFEGINLADVTRLKIFVSENLLPMDEFLV